MNPELEKVRLRRCRWAAVSDPLPGRGRLPHPQGDGQDLGQRRRPTTPPRRRSATGSWWPRFEKEYDAYMDELRKNAQRRAARARGAAAAHRADPGGQPPRGARAARRPAARPPARRRRRRGARRRRHDRRPDREEARRPAGRGRGDHDDAAGGARRRWRRPPPPAAPDSRSRPRPADEPGGRPLLRARLRPRRGRSPGGGSPPTARSRRCWASRAARAPWAGRCGRSRGAGRPRALAPRRRGGRPHLAARRPGPADPAPRGCATEGVRFSRGAAVDLGPARGARPSASC